MQGGPWRLAYSLRTFRPVTLAVAGLMLGLSSFTSVAGAKSEGLLPDLVPHKPGQMLFDVERERVPPRLLLRFDAYVYNAGPGVLELTGSDPELLNGGWEMARVRQRVYRRPDHRDRGVELPPRLGQRILFQPAEQHKHWHFAKAVRYALIDPTGGQADAISEKEDVGFCLADTSRADATAPESPLYPYELGEGCKEEDPHAPSVTMGLTPGWRDLYPLDLEFQWIDVSTSPPGDYILRSSPDPLDVIAEADEANNTSAIADVPITVPGFEALETSADISPVLSSVIDLRHRRHTTALIGRVLGEPEFAIVRPPKTGRLNRQPGEWFRGEEVTYTPDMAATGTDSFAFVVRDSRNPHFPRRPVSAVVTLEPQLPLG